MRLVKSIPYDYQNAPIPGGGYVTGLLYHEEYPEVLYARTDIGGVYRFEYDKQHWKSLIDHVTNNDLAETYPAAIALDPDRKERLFIMCGEGGKECGKFCISDDFGEHFVYEEVPFRVHGNWPGRGTGKRLVVDKKDAMVIYYASQMDGLWQSRDEGKHWEMLPLEEKYTTFVWSCPDQDILVVGTAGYTTRTVDSMRGHSLYVSYDKGETFETLWEPASFEMKDSKMCGRVAQRYSYDGNYLYVTMAATGRWNYIVDMGYSCDTGDTIDGKVLRYEFKENKEIDCLDITPFAQGDKETETAGYCDYGFGGVSVCKSKPGLVACSTLCREKIDDECVYISEDYGLHWRVSLKGLDVGNLRFHTSYMLPKYNGERCLLHWLSDVKINPFDPNELWFNSGTGVFGTMTLLEQENYYFDRCEGIEETVHLNVYAPLRGDVQLVDIVGDLGGFAFRQLDTPCKNSFDDAEGNRYITCINADLSDIDEKSAVITARGNWRGKTKGGLIRTKDGFVTFERLSMPFGLSDETDAVLHDIERPNVNPGWVAASPGGKNIVWSLAKGILLPANLVLVSNDSGNTFEIADIEKGKSFFKAFSDRVKENLFYGFDEESGFYISKDGGKTFIQKKADAVLDEKGNACEFPKVHFGKIDTANKTEVRGLPEQSGIFYMALGTFGLWKMIYKEKEDILTVQRLSTPGESCYRMGLGIAREKTHVPAIYFCGTIEGKYGFYRTFDEGKTCELLNDERQMFGEINSIDGDKREFGRFYLATGSRGVIYGTQKK